MLSPRPLFEGQNPDHRLRLRFKTTMQPGERALDYPTESPQAAPMRDPALGNDRGDSQPTQNPPHGSRVVRAIRVQPFRPAARPPSLASHRRHGNDQRQQLHEVGHVGAGDRHGQGHSLAVDEDVMLRARSPAIGRVRPRRFAAADRTNTAGIRGRTRPVDFIRVGEFGQQNLPQLIPHARRLPIAQATPAGHAAAAVHFLRQILPGNSRAKNEQNTRESGSVVDGRATALRARRMVLRQERLDSRPQFVGYQWCSHDRLLHIEATLFLQVNRRRHERVRWNDTRKCAEADTLTQRHVLALLADNWKE